MTRGLTLGKFAPLHCGHQLLIETALAEVDRLIVMIYDVPEITSIPLTVRAGWIRGLYPEVEVLEAWDGPTTVGSTPEIEGEHERYVLARLGGLKISHFYSSEFYGEHMSRCLGAVDRRVDPSRIMLPVSGTAARRDAYKMRRHIPPRVYRDLITKVVFLGAPSTGKTTIARCAAEQFNTKWVPEFGREYWEQHQVDRRLTATQLLEIAEGHRQREDERILDADRILFVDTDATTTYMFSQYYHGYACPRLSELAIEAGQRYDLYFLCEDDIPYDETWDRSGRAQRSVLQKQIRCDLLRRKVPFISLRGSRDERLATVSAVVGRYDRFESLGNSLLMEQPAP